MISVETAAEILEILGSEDDQIVYLGRDTTPHELAQDLRVEDASQVRIRFYGYVKGQLRMRRGTLRSMVLDRMDH